MAEAAFFKTEEIWTWVNAEDKQQHEHGSQDGEKEWDDLPEQRGVAASGRKRWLPSSQEASLCSHTAVPLI